MPPVRCVSHLPSRGALPIASEYWSTRILLGFRIVAYSEATPGLRVTCYSKAANAPCFSLALFCLMCFFGGSPGLKDTPGFPLLRGMPLVLPRHQVHSLNVLSLPDLEDIPVVRDFSDVFPEELSRMPPVRYV